MSDGFIPRGMETCEHRCCPPAVCDYVKDCHLHSDVALTVPLRGGREGLAPGVAPAGTNTEPNVGEQLVEIMRDLDRTGVAWVAAGYGYDTPEYEAREAVFRRLRAWNERAGAR